MARNTEERIIDTALEVFVEKGYFGATTRAMAEEAGFSELTLFRRFKTKENLFNRVLTEKTGKFNVELEITFVKLDNKFEDPKDFLRALIIDIAKIVDDNFQIVYLMNNDTNGGYGPFKYEFINLVSEFIEENIQSAEIDYQTLTITIFSFVYMRSLIKYKGSNFIDFDAILENFISNSILCI